MGVHAGRQRPHLRLLNRRGLVALTAALLAAFLTATVPHIYRATKGPTDAQQASVYARLTGADSCKPTPLEVRVPAREGHYPFWDCRYPHAARCFARVDNRLVDVTEIARFAFRRVTGPVPVCARTQKDGPPRP